MLAFIFSEQGWISLAAAGLAAMFLMRTVVYRRFRRPTAKPNMTAEAVAQIARIEQRLVDLEVRLHDYERDIQAGTSTRLQHLELLIADADRVSEQLSRSLNQATELGFTAVRIGDAADYSRSREERELKLAGYSDEQVKKLLGEDEHDSDNGLSRAA
ncbi:hypothetical protein [Calycomorphotria hydatis]|uniref:Uncharacterized protein n=1 Tax=Calycomorphotria hydatis TaxID=2528027 RepID=A0A517TAG1_9PLAN|nr:hypothetical protein [Calycomorphotria hydatis]QDT65359.1 hypothetical protein V22_26120 [Calycomorphotria hydatis]